MRGIVVTAGLIVAGVVLVNASARPGPTQPPAGLMFTRITGEPVATERNSTGGVSWVDADGDGDVDLFVANGYNVSAEQPVPQTNHMYENRGGRLTPIPTRLSEDAGFSSGSAWADFDNDGRIDLYIPNQRRQEDFLYRNAGDFRFVPMTGDPVTRGKGLSFSGTWADADNDGWVDLFVSNGGLSGAGPNFLYRNREGTRFEAVSGVPVTDDSLQSSGSSWVDYDLDGDVDLFVPGRQARLYRNDGGFRFTSVDDALPVLERPLMSLSLSGAWGDYDNDGDFDLFLAMYSGERNRLYVNRGNGTFEQGHAGTATLDGGATVDADWADLDNNGWLDLVVANWGAPVQVYLQTNGTFERVVAGDMGTAMAYGSSSAIADYDNDGDLDVLIGHWPDRPGPEEENHLYRNDGPVGNWLRLDLRGTRSNRSAIGARVVVETTLDGRRHVMTQEIRSQAGWRGQSEFTAHFGLGVSAAASTVTVYWPSGVVQRLGRLAANRRIEVVETT